MKYNDVVAVVNNSIPGVRTRKAKTSTSHWRFDARKRLLCSKCDNFAAVSFDPANPLCSTHLDIDRMQKQTAHWRATFEDQVAAGVKETLERGLHVKQRSLVDRTAHESLVKAIQQDANCIRSWYAWGEPSEYGKVLCERIRMEIKIRAQVLIRARKAAAPKTPAPAQ